MFVSCIAEPSSDDVRKALYILLGQFGFKKALTNVYECTAITEKNLAKLKYEIDKVTDSYDIVRLYQYPVKETLAISYLKNKKWKRFFLT